MRNPFSTLGRSLQAPLAKLGALKWPRRRVAAEAVDGVPNPAVANPAQAKAAEAAAAAARDKLNPVGIRRSGPGRRATDHPPRSGEAGLEEDLAALRRRSGALSGTERRADAAAADGAAPGAPAAPARKPSVFTGLVYRQDVRVDRGRLKRGDEAFLDGVRQAQVTEATPGAMASLYLLGIALVCAGVWATQAKVDVVTKVDGKVVPEAREQVIASLEGGILRAMHVREGDIVNAGQELLQLDPTRLTAQQNEGVARLVALRGTEARLRAEMHGQALVFPPEVRTNAAVVASETEAYQARRKLLDEAIGITRRNLGLIDSELGTAQSMADQGLMSQVEVMRLRRQRNDLQIQVQERANRFRQDASTELLRVRSELAQIGEQQVVKDDAVRRTVLTAPLHGIVKNIRIGTLGGVIGPGAAILEIVPITDQVLVEARIKPADIGFVHVGMPAEVKLSAYDYYTYGGLKGTIDYISPDALGDDKLGATADNSYYRARIRTDASKLRGKADKPLGVLPGMNASVEIRTGERTVMEFILKPMLKGTEALRER